MIQIETSFRPLNSSLAPYFHSRRSIHTIHTMGQYYLPCLNPNHPCQTEFGPYLEVQIIFGLCFGDPGMWEKIGGPVQAGTEGGFRGPRKGGIDRRELSQQWPTDWWLFPHPQIAVVVVLAVPNLAAYCDRNHTKKHGRARGLPWLASNTQPCDRKKKRHRQWACGSESVSEWRMWGCTVRLPVLYWCCAISYSVSQTRLLYVDNSYCP